MNRKLTNFYTRFYVYVNQVFGDANVRHKYDSNDITKPGFWAKNIL